MNSPPDQDPLQFLKSLWGQMGIPFSGMITPTLDVGLHLNLLLGRPLTRATSLTNARTGEFAALGTLVREQ